jgi:hypothetical protein
MLNILGHFSPPCRGLLEIPMLVQPNCTNLQVDASAALKLLLFIPVKNVENSSK